MTEPAFDVAVVGAGPVGTVVALAHARLGARVALLESNPKGAQRLAGEWLHPAALGVLRELDLDLASQVRYPTGTGFVVFPDDGTAPVVLPYDGGGRGCGIEHRVLVESLRAAAEAHPRVSYIAKARVVNVADDSITIVRPGETSSFSLAANRIVGADGRQSVVRAALAPLSATHDVASMAGLRLTGVALPFEGYGHVFVGGPGVALAYRIGVDQIRLLLDLRSSGGDTDRAGRLWDDYAPILPDPLRAALHDALSRNALEMARAPIAPRTVYGEGRLALVGDATGHLHPLTASGIALGFDDAMVLSRSASVAEYASRRRAECLVPQMVAVGIHEIFACNDAAAVAVRRAVIELWRSNRRERERTIRYIACADRRIAPFARSFLKVMARTATRLVQAIPTSGWRHTATTAGTVVRRARHWLMRVVRPVARPVDPLHPEAAGGIAGAAAKRGPDRPGAREGVGHALERGVRALVGLQRDSGDWEGEVVWCPMLTAQYVIACHVMGVTVTNERRRRAIVQFERTRLDSGAWGLHPRSTPYLFVTTLVYVAARLLGTAADDPLLSRAHAFIVREGTATIPTWGKFWLAMLGLYRWEGVNPVLPEAWLLPRWVPIRPGNLYCHTRLIAMAMAAIYGRKFQAPSNPVVAALRDELYPAGFDRVDFAGARQSVCAGDLATRPTWMLRLLLGAMGLMERWHSRGLRKRTIASLEEKIRWELRTTDHASISPVSGLLNLIALWIANPADPDCERGLRKLEDWTWEDDRNGLRIAGARSTSWDTAFALQALSAAAPHVPAHEALARGVAFLATQQIDVSFPDFAAADRIDPHGGWCFAGVWHGWPVSDCTAEALSALLHADSPAIDARATADGVDFMLRCQNRDGGFGSYEPVRSWFPLEYLNSAEMFADSMSESSFIECTASCAIALAAVRQRYPTVMAEAVAGALKRSAAFLRRCQGQDGDWPAAWGVNRIYGTLFGICGLRAAGVPASDPAVRKACAWLKARQRGDGGWGEHFSGCRTGTYVPHDHSQAIQTAWALRALLEAEDSDFAAIERAARFLAGRQCPDGTWPAEEMAGVFFKTALLDYVLYRSYFPVWALALYETRRNERAAVAADISPARSGAVRQKAIGL